MPNQMMYKEQLQPKMPPPTNAEADMADEVDLAEAAQALEVSRLAVTFDRLLGQRPGSDAKPIKEIIATHIQKPAYLGQIFEFKKNQNDEYVFIAQDDKRSYQLEGVFAFVILPNEPDRIYCGSQNKGLTEAGKPYEYKYRYNDLYIDGHIALAHSDTLRQPNGSTDILFGGTLFFRNGKLELWTNGSGHYRPDAELRHTNLSPAVKHLLPESLFQVHDTITDEQDKFWGNYLKISKEEEQTFKEYLKEEYNVADSDSSLSDDD